LSDANIGHFRTDFCNFSSDIAAGNVGKRDGDIRQPAANPQIEMIQGASAHAHENFVGAWLRAGNIDVLQNFGSAMLTEEDSLHDASRLF
jgi:hypothetical protein